jgi:hypothetical protein
VVCLLPLALVFQIENAGCHVTGQHFHIFYLLNSLDGIFDFFIVMQVAIDPLEHYSNNINATEILIFPSFFSQRSSFGDCYLHL